MTDSAQTDGSEAVGKSLEIAKWWAEDRSNQCLSLHQLIDVIDLAIEDIKGREPSPLPQLSTSVFYLVDLWQSAKTLQAACSCFFDLTGRHAILIADVIDPLIKTTDLDCLKQVRAEVVQLITAETPSDDEGRPLWRWPAGDVSGGVRKVNIAGATTAGAAFSPHVAPTGADPVSASPSATPRKERRGPRKETNLELKVQTAFLEHHNFDSPTGKDNCEPAKFAEIAKSAGVSESFVAIVVKKALRVQERPSKHYKEACLRGDFITTLALWAGRLPPKEWQPPDGYLEAMADDGRSD